MVQESPLRPESLQFSQERLLTSPLPSGNCYLVIHKEDGSRDEGFMGYDQLRMTRKFQDDFTEGVLERPEFRKGKNIQGYWVLSEGNTVRSEYINKL